MIMFSINFRPCGGAYRLSGRGRRICSAPIPSALASPEARNYDHMFKLPGHVGSPCRTGRGSSSGRAGSPGIVAADAITDNGMGLADREWPLKDRPFKKLLPDFVWVMNPWAAFIKDAEAMKNTI